MSWNWWIASRQMSVPGDPPQEVIDQAVQALGVAVARAGSSGEITVFLAVPAESEQDATAAAGPGLARAAGMLGTTATGGIRVRPSGSVRA